MPAPFFTTNQSEFSRLEGLYIYEQNPPGFIRGVSLGTVAVMGQCVRGPIDTPIEITSEARFLEIFGGRDYGSGGAIIGDVWRALLNKPFGRLIVCRAAAAAAVKASLTCETGVDGAGTAVLRIDASSAGAWGNNIKARIDTATNGDANYFNLVLSYLGSTTTYENLNISTGVDNTLEVLGDDEGNLVTLTKLASGRPANFSTITEVNWEANDDADNYMNLGTTLSAYAYVAGANGTLAASDYTGTDRALDKIKEYKGVGVVFCAEDESDTIVQSVNSAMITAAASASDRLFLIWTGDHTDSVSDVDTYADTLTRLDRVVLCENSPYTVDSETGTAIRTPPVEWMASILSQIDVDINPGEESTKAYTAGITSLTNESRTREDYITLKEAGVASLEKDEGFSFVSAVTMSLTSGKEQITRRRSADFLQLSAANRLKWYVKKKNTAANRRVMGNELLSFSNSLRDQGRVVEEFSVTQDSVNTEAQRAQGIEYILWRVKLIDHMLHIVLKTEIGTGVVIEA